MIAPLVASLSTTTDSSVSLPANGVATASELKKRTRFVLAGVPKREPLMSSVSPGDAMEALMLLTIGGSAGGGAAGSSPPHETAASAHAPSPRKTAPSLCIPVLSPSAARSAVGSR